MMNKKIPKEIVDKIEQRNALNEEIAQMKLGRGEKYD